MTKVKQLIKKDFVRFTRQNLYKVTRGILEIYAKPDVLRSTRRAVSNYKKHILLPIIVLTVFLLAANDTYCQTTLKGFISTVREKGESIKTVSLRSETSQIKGP